MREPGYYEYTLCGYEGPAVRDNVHVAFRVSKKLKQEAGELVSKGVFQDESELFRAALRELIVKYKVMAIENQGSS